jgi:hypothetical protein|tara:strand:+ start:3656 stop:3859 length:204 start_codon:yes stop_codon:yes gene_type:complete
MKSIKTSIHALFCSQSRLSWRRLAVLALGTGLLLIDRLDSQEWLYLGLAYIAGDSAEKAMAAIGKRG